MLPNTLQVRVVSTIYQNVSALNIVYMCVSQVSSLLKFPLSSLPSSHSQQVCHYAHVAHNHNDYANALSAGAVRQQLSCWKGGGWKEGGGGN